MSNDKPDRTTIYTANEARQRLDVLMDQVIDRRDEPVLIYHRGKEPVALVAVAELADWLETAAYPGKYAEDENAGDVEHGRLAHLLHKLEIDHILSRLFLSRLLDASDQTAADEVQAAADEGVCLSAFEQIRGSSNDRPAWKAVMERKFLADLYHWVRNNHRLAKQTVLLVRETLRDPFQGRGMPEQLRGQRSGEWSRHIDEEHRLIYTITADSVRFLAARNHY